MAINYTVSYTFSPNTTISSSQVNTNFSDNSNTWTGLEALTKSFAKLKVDVDPTTSLEVSTKQYVDHYSTYRKPVLQYSSGTVVNVESGINGTSGQVQVLFPDGNLRTDSTSGRVNCNFAQVAALSGTAQSGLRTGTVAVNTWYAVYMVKTSDNTSNMVAVADTVLPIQANFSTLNSNFGSNSWVYLGLARNGDNSGATTGILKFVQNGHMTLFYNDINPAVSHNMGTLLAFGNGSTSTTTYSYSAGTGAAAIPNNIGLVKYGFAWAWVASARGNWAKDSGGTQYLMTDVQASESSSFSHKNGWYPATLGVQMGNFTVNNQAVDILLQGWIDNALGVGSNPLL